ncbi:hypothetical protein GCM10010970_16440 [Silvimonas iriomotensis]|uniref:Uncharacterized protein n=1 Tax=Silvimonas iriomotensis TaxID=449662 RepID=A0ABQ2P8W2_9NEIS|nr:hypothetical protein GCM10010970_16440 [Silvimonas iriomotensis]
MSVPCRAAQSAWRGLKRVSENADATHGGDGWPAAAAFPFTVNQTITRITLNLLSRPGSGLCHVGEGQLIRLCAGKWLICRAKAGVRRKKAGNAGTNRLKTVMG